ncbi:MAG: 23S rRNA (guanosine(2251)-2'-O)-methyltransferase RlmB [Aestuariivita sp.]|nr:23S rRNA (guanosine(2251)-2'-O)-methyltransferase RlmB [Aestuariivita sp.]MCY4347687.1 23S rRNA (guanosine(2251)-2'-O)-methyltransferase RlmB [Aestuariivita sp.]
MTTKPSSQIRRARFKRENDTKSIWLFGLHAVRAALLNPKRDLRRLIVTKNAFDQLADAIHKADITPEITDTRKFTVPLSANSVHQGAVLETLSLSWGELSQYYEGANCLILLDQVTDPNNVGAILRSADALGADAVIGTLRHASPETGALAKVASGALERLPYFRVPNLARTIVDLRKNGFVVLGLDHTADKFLDQEVHEYPNSPIALVLGAEGKGLRSKTQEVCDQLIKIRSKRSIGSLNVSNAAAIALYSVLSSREFQQEIVHSYA